MAKSLNLISLAVSDDEPAILTFNIKATASSLKPITNTKGEAKGTRNVSIAQDATDDLFALGEKITATPETAADDSDWLFWVRNFIPATQGGAMEAEMEADEPAEEEEAEITGVDVEAAAPAEDVEAVDQPTIDAEEDAVVALAPPLDTDAEEDEAAPTSAAPVGAATLDSVDKMGRHVAREAIKAMGKGRKSLLFQIAGHPASPMLRKAARARLTELGIEMSDDVKEVSRPSHDVRNQKAGTVMSRKINHRGDHADWGECEYTVELLDGGKFKMIAFTGNRTEDFLKPDHVFGGSVEMLASFVGKPKGKHGTTIGRFFKLMSPRKAVKKVAAPTGAEEAEMAKRMAAAKPKAAKSKAESAKPKKATKAKAKKATKAAAPPA